MKQTQADYCEKLSAYQRREIDEERALEDAIPDMWAMSLDEMDCALRRAMRGRISKQHRARIQGMIDALDEIATTAPSYIR